MEFGASRRIVALATAIACVCLVAAGLVVGTNVAADDGDEPDLSPHYGFLPLEIFKLEQRSAHMLAADLDGDGLTDLLIADNSHSRLDLLLQRREKPAERATKELANHIDSDWRFEHVKIPVDKEITSLAVGDFDGDGRTDIAYFGSPDRLIIRYQDDKQDWSRRTEFRLPDVEERPWNVAAGDLDGDGKTDLAVLGKTQSYVILQDKEGKLAQPKSLMNTSEKLGLARIVDIDGDGRDDLCYLADEPEGRALCVRRQTADGRLGPELRFPLGRPRAVTLADVDGKPGTEILTIDSRTGRLTVRKLVPPDDDDAEDEPVGRLVQYGFGSRSSSRERDLATGDLDGDGLIDVVVTDPEAARMIVYRQVEKRGLDLGEAYPGLVGAEHVRVADVDGDGSAEVVVLSVREKTIGLSRLQGNRLTFPASLPVQDEPVAFDLADLDRDGKPEVVYIARRREARDSRYLLRALKWSKGDEWKPLPFGASNEIALDLPGEPKRLTTLDANRDRRPDFLAFIGLDRPPALLVTDADGVPKQVDSPGGIRLGDVAAGAVFVGGEKHPLLVAQENFARNMRLDDKNQWEVVDQYNATETNARIAGVAALDLDGEEGEEIVLVDTGVKKLRILRQEDDLHRPWREIEMESFLYESARVADLDGDGRDDLLLMGRGKFAVLYAGRRELRLKDVGSFETRLKDTSFADVVAGDLNGDGTTDLALIDTQSHYVEIVRCEPESGPRHAIHFRLFEEKNFSGARIGGTEPRESLIADVTGDGLPDLVLLAHDRVLVLPQDKGPDADTAER
ncbi:MAG: VCBS repeat-containing protein [Planctomycetaceae bacterium]